MTGTVNWDLVIPQALLPDGSLVTPEQVTRQHGPFRCPECRSEVVLRWGKWVRRHFAHIPDSDCSLVRASESWWHKTAKSLVVNVVNDWATQGAPEPRLFPVLCGKCERRGIEPDRLSAVVAGIVRAQEEARIPGISVIPDVAAFDGDDRVLLAVELVRTHAMDAAKVASYRAAGIPWVEIDAAHLVNKGAFAWRPFRTWRSPAGRCEICGDEAERPEKARLHVARDGEYGSTPTTKLDKREAEMLAAIDAGGYKELPFGPLFCPPATVDRKSVRFRSVVRDGRGRSVGVYEDAAYARRVADFYNRIWHHFEARMRAQDAAKGDGMDG